MNLRNRNVMIRLSANNSPITPDRACFNQSPPPTQTSPVVEEECDLLEDEPQPAVMIEEQLAALMEEYEKLKVGLLFGSCYN